MIMTDEARGLRTENVVVLPSWTMVIVVSHVTINKVSFLAEDATIPVDG